MNAPTFGSLFSGIGGLDLGLERAGFRVAWQCESDPYARAVLREHWPDVPCYDDVRGLDGNEPAIDLLCGGFPCQDISFAGAGAGLDGERSGLWREFARAIGLFRPRFVLVENVAALLVRGLETVLADLAALGFDAEWSTFSACAVGATHMRQRVFVVAYPHGFVGPAGLWDSAARPDGTLQPGIDFARSRARARARMEDPSALYRGADGVPARLERNRALGNAVYPDNAEWIGRHLLAAWKEILAA